MTTPLITTRDAVAEALHDLACGCAEPGEHSYALADALIATGVVRAADTLADDEALVERVVREIDYDPTEDALADVRAVIAALAAALVTPTTEDQ